MSFRVYVVLSVLLFNYHFLSSQQDFVIKVMDHRGAPVEGAIIKNLQHESLITSDANGMIHLHIDHPADSFYLEHLNYRTKTIPYLELKGTINTILLDDYKALLPQTEIISSWVNENSAIVHTTLDFKKINSNYFAQDVPYLIQHLPSSYSSSDAGNGIGYTAVRIRGLDPSQVNVLINGMAFNDAESQGVYWVDIPDIIASAASIQVQRGIGLSGAGQVAFGSSILINTNRFNPKPFLQLESCVGSYQTLRSSIQAGTGNLPHHWNIEGRLSKVYSAGYIDRARSTLYSGGLSISKIADKRSFRLHIFDGLENTYQAWNGVPEQYIHTDKRTFNTAGTEKAGDPYNNQIDKYRQTNFQLIHHEQLSRAWSLQNTLHYTPGHGYYEEYKADQKPSKYKLDGSSKIDLVRRRFLSNDFLGSIHSAVFTRSSYNLTIGAAWNYYKGQHYGQVIKASGKELINPLEYYRNQASKWSDMVFGKMEYKIKAVTILADVQLRNMVYRYNKESENTNATYDVKFHFFNPKIGFTWQANSSIHFFGFTGIAHREPNRDDYVKADLIVPKPERLIDHELGIRYQSSTLNIEQNFYSMNYKDQLIPTGKLNDVGSYIRSNVDQSYRLGAETTISWAPFKKLTINSNLNFSKNNTKEFIEYIDNWDNGTQEARVHKNQPIAFSPTHIFNIEAAWDAFHIHGMNLKHDISFTPSYQSIGKQYLDGTGAEASLLPGYALFQCIGSYSVSKGSKRIASISFQLNNLFNKRYESNGWIYRFRSPSYNPVADDPYSKIEAGDLYHQKGFFPQAGRNFLIGVKIYFGEN